MRLHVLSDVHLEFGKLQRYSPPECDVVILAGDVSTGVAGLIWAAETFDVPVIYVAGNHCFYGKRIYQRHLDAMRAKAAGTKVHFLNNDLVRIGDVEFIGSILWTDFNLYGNPPMAMLAAAGGTNDYRMIRKSERTLLRPEDTREFHERSRFFISEALLHPPCKQVVVTHFAPSEQSSLPRFRGDPLTPAYASRLENLILDTQPALWVHGHMHNSSDYMIGETRVVCNPRGYAGVELNPDFDPGLVIEI